mgnify:CR=1 FL=1
MKIIRLFFILFAVIAKTAHSEECVILLHGLAKSNHSMEKLAESLADEGYETVNYDYPSRSASIKELATTHVEAAVKNCSPHVTIHFVTHSMGGILVRQYLQTHELPPGGKVVMLSPPNQGSKLSEFFFGNWFYEAIVGPAGVSLTKQSEGIISSLLPVKAPVGIIAAYRGWSLWPQSWLPEPNDGTVSLASMILPEMSDFVVVNSGHAMMRYSDKTHSYIRQFIKHGRFYAKYDESEKKMALFLRDHHSLTSPLL